MGGKRLFFLRAPGQARSGPAIAFGGRCQRADSTDPGGTAQMNDSPRVALDRPFTTNSSVMLTRLLSMLRAVASE